MLLPIEQILNQDELQPIRQRLQEAQWQDGQITAGTQAAGVKNNLQLDNQSELAISLGQQILSRLSQHPVFMSAALPDKFVPPRFNCYQNGGQYGMHVDNAIMFLSNPHEIVRTDLSATLFLSEPDEYDGGELMIETEYGAQAIKLAAGDLILYPSTSLHRVTPVTKGARIAAFFWVQSMVRDAQYRSLLFDLDQSIQNLTVERGNQDSEVQRLTGIYHNLVRSWAET